MLRGLSLCLCLMGAPLAANPVVEAEAAADDLQAAAIALGEARQADDRITALTQTVRAFEDALGALRGGIRQAEIRARSIEARLAQDEAQLANLLAALQIIQRTPAQVLLIHPNGPIGSARAGMMVSELTPGLQLKADQLSQDLADLALIRQTQQVAQTQLQSGLVGAQEARAELARVMSEREGVPPVRPDPVLLQAILEGSDSLAAFALGLEALALVPGQTQGFGVWRGRLPLPVSGSLLRGYNVSDQAGVARPGWILAVEPDSLVSSPVAATVRYSGPLLDFGNVIVLEPEAGYLLIIAGLGTVFTRTGDVPGEGDPLGLIAGDPLPTSGFDGGQSRRETLYLEIRQNQQPVDPVDWFANDKD